ncbi:MAG: phage holin family protein [Solirubrobacteraceae bacterium]
MSSVDNTDGPALKERSIGELLQQLSQETTTLVRQELELARAELTEKGKEAGKGAGMFGGAGVMALLAAGALTTCIIAALDTAMALWLAALIVAVVYGAIAGVLALQGRDRVKRATPPVPEQTIDSTKEDVAWAKTRARSGSR